MTKSRRVGWQRCRSVRRRVAGALAACAVLAGPLVHAALPPLPDWAEPQFSSVGRGVIARDVVASLAQDRSGFLWIGTGDGLVRHDGYSFRAVQREDADPARRNLGWVAALLPGADGRLWIASEFHGLVYHDPVTGRIHTAAAQAGAGGAVLRALAQDRDGQVWIGSVENGLARFDPTTGRYAVERSPASAAAGLPDARVLSLLSGRDGSLWIGTWRGLARRRPGQTGYEAVPLPGADTPRIQALMQAADGRLWLGTAQGGVAVLDPGSGAVQWLQAPGPLPRGQVHALLQAADGTVWIGTRTGLEWRDAQTLRLLRRVTHDPRRPAGLAADDVSALISDRAGRVWVGGLGLGLQRHNPLNRTVLTRGPDLRPGSPLPQANVRTLLTLADGRSLLSTPQGLVTLDRELRIDGALWQPAAHARPGDTTTEPISAMAQSADGLLWLARGDRLLRFDAQRRPRGAWRIDGGAVRRLLPADDGTLWIGSDDGLYRLPMAQAGARPEPVPGPDGQPLRGPVSGLARAADGQLWVGGAAGLFQLPPGATRLAAVPSPEGQGLGSRVVLDLLIDRQQRLWVDCAVSGLHRLAAWDGHAARFDGISARHGVLNRPFGANLVDDAQGRIWTQQYRYDPATDQLLELGPADGKDFGMGWFHSHGRDTQGRLLFGGTKGLLVVQPEQLQPNGPAAPLVFTDLRIDGRAAPTSRLDGGLQLQPGERSLALGFAALDYSDPGRLRYAVRLAGFDRDWIDTPADQRLASYGNLEPGSYRLEVRASDRHGRWGETTLSLPLTVAPNWWQRPVSRVAAVLLALAGVAALVRWRTAALRRQREALAEQVAQRTAELEQLTRALQQESAALQDASLTDPLTGLRNRRYFNQNIRADVAACLQHPEVHDLLFFIIDIDHFKRLNDSLGHAAGDAVLALMRQRLESVFRADDRLVRWGGEEFLVVVRGARRQGAMALAERLRRQVAEQPFTPPAGPPIHCSVSIGFAAFPLHLPQPEAVDWLRVLGLADAALYAAKQQGRNAWCGVLGLQTGTEATPANLPEAGAWLKDGTLDVRRSPPAAPPAP